VKTLQSRVIKINEDKLSEKTQFAFYKNSI